jgi:drug/metabolite transporter (DMT)-like permease
MKLKNYAGQLALIICTFIWGTAFVAQSTGMAHVGPAAFTAARNYLGAIVLIPCIIFLDWILDHRAPSLWGKSNTAASRKMLVLGGLCCGLALAAASLSQQFGVKYTTVAKSGFITTLYIIFVPFFGYFVGRKPTWRNWLCAIIAMVGMYLLCCAGESQITRGDLYVLLCAALFACHILVVDRFASFVDCVRMSCVQFLVAAIISTLVSLAIGETTTLAGLRGAAFSIFYCGVLSSGVAFTLQIIGQKYVNPCVASLLMCMESVFASVSGWLILHQKLALTELCGCAIILTAVIIAQLPSRKNG